MTAEIEVAGQFGSQQASDAVVPIFMHAMKPAGVAVPLRSLDSRIKQLSLLLRVSGNIQRFEGQPVENVKFARDRRWVSVDILLWEKEWEGKTNPEIAAVLAGRVRSVPEVIEPLMQKRKLAMDNRLLTEELSRFATGFQLLAKDL